MLKILIVDDNLEFVQFLFNTIKKHNENDFIITNIFSDGNNAYNYLSNNSPDVILLDLQMPKLNGIELISKLKDNNILPKIIIISGDTSLLHKIIKLGVNIEQVFYKPIDTTLLVKLLDKLMKEKNEDIINREILKYLDKFYFNKSSPGYLYIFQCIKLCLDNNKLISPFETNLYVQIAKQNNIKSNKVIKWSIDKTISSMNKYTNSSTLNEFFPYSKVTPKIFINDIFQRISMDMKK